MKHITKEKLSVEVAAAKSGFGRTSGFNIRKELGTESKKEKKPEADVVGTLLKASGSLRCSLFSGVPPE